jgi:hypothetical protein
MRLCAMSPYGSNVFCFCPDNVQITSKASRLSPVLNELYTDLRKGKRLNIADIFGICNHSPPPVPSRVTPIPPGVDEDFTRIFLNDYCTGLDVMLQTTWFTTNNNALNRVFTDRALHEEAAFFTETMQANSGGTPHASVFSQEARIIWHLLGTCKHIAPTTNGIHGSVPGYAEHEEMSLREARARFDVLEALMTNQNIASNPLRQLQYPADLPDPKKSEVDFWLHLGDFVQYSGAEHAPPGATDYALATMRNVLQVQEVRDAIYSMAIARHCGSRVGGFPNALAQPVYATWLCCHGQ